MAPLLIAAVLLLAGPGTAAPAAARAATPGARAELPAADMAQRPAGRNTPGAAEPAGSGSEPAGRGAAPQGRAPAKGAESGPGKGAAPGPGGKGPHEKAGEKGAGAEPEVVVPTLPATQRARLIERGDEFYRHRGDGHIKDRAVPANITTALDAYLEAFDGGERSEGIFIRIMRATYFYATYVGGDKSRRRKAVDRAIEIGREGLKRFPRSAGINYWMAALWGAWSRLHGHFASAREDVASKIRAYAGRTIELDPTYAEGGGYRTLGRLHYLTPHIPFFLTWPDKKKALDLLEKAVKVGPKNLTNHLFYAEALLDRGYKDRARKEVEIVEKAGVDEESVVETLRTKEEAAKLVAKIYENVDTGLGRRMIIK